MILLRQYLADFPAMADSEFGIVGAPTPARQVNSRLLRLIALHGRAYAACDRFDDEVEMPARRACGAYVDALPLERAPPHEESATAFVNVYQEMVRLSTESIMAVATGRRMLADREWAASFSGENEDWKQAHIEIAAAGDRRDKVIAEQAARRKVLVGQAKAAFRLDQIAQRASDLDERRYRLREAVIKQPAESLTDVATKFAFIERLYNDDDIPADYFAALAADIRRLNQKGRAHA